MEEKWNKVTRNLTIRGLEHLSYEERLRVGVVEPGEEKASSSK